MRLLAGAVGISFVLALATAASAAVISGTAGSDRLTGTAAADSIFGRGGNDRLLGGGGPDFLHGGPGRDFVADGGGDDRVAVNGDGAVDTVLCGRGREIVNADLTDRIAPGCEVVSRQLSRDRSADSETQHATQVEPDSFAFGSTIVTTFQSGRHFVGAAAQIGFSTSRDGGRTWRSGFLPALTVFSSPPGTAGRASDPAVTYDAAHGVWLIATLAVSTGASELFVSRSTDGLRWSPPVVAARSTTSALAYDKEWIGCDNGPSSRFRGRCYLSYTEVRERGPDGLATQSSSDGGLTWTAAALGTVGELSGAQPVALPNGDLLVIYLEWSSAMWSVRSLDGGATFEAPRRIADVAVRMYPAGDASRGQWSIRAFPLPSVEASGDGTVYVAWHDCRFRTGCAANDIVFSSSSDGASWTSPRRVPIGSTSSAGDRFVPGIAVDPQSRGANTRLAVAYHSLPDANCFPNGCVIDVGLITSNNGGATWSRPQRLTAQSMPLAWLADTRYGRMTGDYISTSYSRGRAVPVFSLAWEPGEAGRLNQAIFATTPDRGA